MVVIDDGERVIWDHRLTGPGIRLRARSSPVWIGQRRIDGRTVKRTFGTLDDMGIDEARGVARATFDHDGQRLRVAPTLAGFVPIFIDDNAGRWKPNTIKSHRRDLLRHVVPVLGTMPVDAISRADVLAWQDRLDVAPGSRNRILAVLSGLMLHAESLGFRAEGSNPCAGLRRRQTGFKARYLDDHDFARLAAALDQAESARPIEVAAIRFLMLTGARQSEALALEWTMIHGSRAVLPDSKTGPKTIWLCAPVRRCWRRWLRFRHRRASSPCRTARRYAVPCIAAGMRCAPLSVSMGSGCTIFATATLRSRFRPARI